jgi:hypothetical protein
LPYKAREEQLAEYKKTKGVPSRSLDLYEHEAYLKVIAEEKAIVARFHKLTATNHRITEQCLRKQAVGIATDKRYLKSCSVCSLAYGHKDIPSKNECFCFL